MENPRSNRRLTIDISRNINRNNDENGSDKGKNIYNPFERLSASQSPSSSSTSLIPISLDNSQNSMELLVSTIRNLQVQFGKMSSIQEQLVGQVHKMSRVILNFTRQNEHEQFDSNPIAHDQSSQSDHDCRSWFNAWITDSDALFLNPSPSFLNPFPFPFGNGEDCPFSSISSPSSTVIQIVLIVEDDQMCSCLIGNLLKYHNIDYRVAKTGYEAINATWSCDFNLILMDINLPELNGIEATRMIRNHNKHTPIVSMTSGIEYDNNSGHLEINDKLIKPFSAQNLLSIIRKYNK